MFPQARQNETFYKKTIELLQLFQCQHLLGDIYHQLAMTYKRKRIKNGKALLKSFELT